MKFRQAKKIMHGNSSVHEKYRKRRPPYKKFLPERNEWVTVHPSLHDIDIIRRAFKTFIHHYKRHKRKDLT